MRLDRFLKRFTGSNETPTTSGRPPAPVPALRFADAHIAELEHVRRALVEHAPPSRAPRAGGRR